MIDAGGDITAGTSGRSEAIARLNSIYQAIPIPTYTWQIVGGDVVLIDYNRAALAYTNNKVKDILGKSVADYYADQPAILDDFKRCMSDKSSFDREMTYWFRSQDTFRHINAKYSFVEPDLILVMTEDISARMEMESKLHDQQQQLAIFVEHSPASLAMLDSNMCYIMTSRRWLTDYNLESMDIIGKSHYDVFPEIRQEWRDLHQRCLKGEIERREVDIFDRQDGTTDWVRWEMRPWHKINGEIGGLIMFTEVINDRKLLEDELKNSADKLRQIIQNLPIGLCLVQKDGTLGFINNVLTEMFGYTVDDIPSLDVWWRVAYPDTEYRAHVQKTWFDRVETSIRTNAPFEPFQATICCKDGTNKFFEFIFAPLDGDSIVIFRDITDVKIAEDRLKNAKLITEKSEARLIEAQKTTKVGSWETDLRDLAVIWSQETYHIFELDVNTFHATHEAFLEFVHPEDKEKVDDAFRRSFQSTDYNSIEHRIISSNGTIKHVEERWKIEFDDQGIPIRAVGTCQDISHRKAIEQALIENEEKYRTLFNSSQDAILLFSDGTWVDCNVNATKLFGCSREQLLRNHPAEL